ncbi:MAG TPA: DNA-processing protein DprA [Rhodothermia bacterium]
MNDGSAYAAVTLDVDEQRALIALSLIQGLGPGRIRSAVARIGSAQDVLTAPFQMLCSIPGIGHQTAEAIRTFDGFDLVDEQIRIAEEFRATFIPTWDERYPEPLRHIYDPPTFLWSTGIPTEADNRAIAIVGTRRATRYGRTQACEFASGLARAGYTIVSGLAYGIDTSAHLGALEAGGRTIAVLGSGVDRIYPSRNVDLARRIVANGCVLSEYPLRTPPDAVNFPRRNRIISGLSLGVLVVEAFATGGALITARLATEQDREVFAIPSPLPSEGRPGEGNNRLIQRSHAKLVTSVEDILVELPGGTTTTGQVHLSPEPELQGPEAVLWSVLEPEPVHIDTLCSRSGLDPSSALVHLLGLEFKGLVRQLAGKQFQKA